MLVRRNILFILMSVEIMLNAAGLAFVVAGARWGQPDGQVMFIFILADGRRRGLGRAGAGAAAVRTSSRRWTPTRQQDARMSDARICCG